jgi:hypothetical protein
MNYSRLKKEVQTSKWCVAIKMLRMKTSQGPGAMVHVYILSYSGGRDRRITV